jgi:ABC-2 type transport system permease protein
VIGPLLRKEILQVRRSRGALLSGILLPLLLMVVMPGFQLASLRSVAPQESASLPGQLSDPDTLFTSFLLPLVVALTGLIVPSVAATYTVVAEHERRTLELLMALPVRALDVLRAKMLAMLMLALAVAVPLFAVDAAAVLLLGLADVGYVVQLLLILLAALVCSVCEALVLALVARDLRTTNNLNGALITPVTFAMVAILLGAPPGVGLPALAALLLVLALAAYLCAARWLTFERYLSG